MGARPGAATLSMNSLAILNARIIDPASGTDAVGSIFAEEGQIRTVGSAADLPAAETVIDAAGLVAAPGFIDLHVHLREPGREDKETIATGSRAAAAGGFTTIGAIPNTSPVIDSQTGLKFIISRAETDSVVNVLPYAAVTRGQQGEEIVEFGDLVYYGARAFTDDGHPIMNAEIMRRALEYSRMFNVPILDHCEDLHLARCGVMHEGDVSMRLGLSGIPGVAESVNVGRDVELAGFTGGHLHVMHVSKESSLVHIRSGKQRGFRVTCEVTPHHLALTDEALAGFNTNAKVNPPIGSESDRQALLAALADGTIDCIATDHAPHTAIEKDQPIQDAPNGAIGLETAFAVVNTYAAGAGHLTLPQLIEKMTSAPAGVLNLLPRGTLAPGAPADIVLLDPAATVTIEPDFFFSRSRNSPFLGHTLQGAVVATIVGGRVVYRERQFLP